MGLMAGINSLQLVFDKSNGGFSILPTLVLSQGTHNHRLESIFLVDHGSYLPKVTGIVTFANAEMFRADLWLLEVTWSYVA